MKYRDYVKIGCALIAVMGAIAPGMAATSLKRGAPKVNPLSKEEFAEMRGKLGACIVRRAPEAVGKLMDHSDSLTTDYAGMGVQAPVMFNFQLRLDLCQNYNRPQLNQPIFVKPGALRNLLMEQAYLAKFAKTPQPLLDEKGEPKLAPPRTFVTKGEQLPQAVAYAALADCTAATGSELADAMLRTGAGMPEERTAAVALAPVIGQCVQEGQNIALTQETIRALAAEGMWQRYMAKPAPTAQASAK
jgi:hypothetical protein